MKGKIRRAAVLGAGVMGSEIAAHLANIGIPTCLLDIIPGEPNEEDKRRGLTAESPAFRNKLARIGIEKAIKTSPAAFYLPENAKLITPGNFEDLLHWLSEVDWIIEAIIENLEIKKSLFEQVDKFRSPDTLVTTNTSGLSINKMSEELSLEFKEHFQHSFSEEYQD